MAQKEESSKYYNCSECSSLIEILSINENDNTIEFNCLNKNKAIKISIEDYLKNMKKSTPEKINNDICDMHNDKYVCYCFDCNNNICEKCLKSRNHIHHDKNHIIEIQPTENEIKVYMEIIRYYNNEINKLKNENMNKIKEMEKIYNDKKIKYERIKNNKKIMNKNKEKNELKKNEELYLSDINNIKKRYRQEILIRKNKYIADQNKIIVIIIN